MLNSQARQFGESLVERHVLSRDVLEDLIDESARMNLPLPTILLQRGLVGPKDLAAALCVALGMQLLALIDGPELPRRLLITSAFGAWHGLLADPPFYGPLLDAMLVSAGYAAVALILAYRTFRRREIGG